MNEKKRLLCAAGLHAVLLVLECVAFYPCPFTAELKFYTQLSNLLELFASALFLADCIRCLKKGRTRPALWVRVLSYAAACMLTVTLLVVLFILAPMMREEGGLRFLMLSGSMLYMHFLCPVLALVAFICFEKEPPLTRRHLLLAMLPTLLYAAVTITLNVLRVMRGPYPFLYVYEQPLYMSFVWATVVIGGALLIAWGLKKLNASGAGRKA